MFHSVAQTYMYCRWLYCSYSERAATAFIHGIDGEVKLQTHTHAHACMHAHMHAHAHTHSHTHAHPAIPQAFLYGASIPGVALQWPFKVWLNSQSQAVEAKQYEGSEVAILAEESGVVYTANCEARVSHIIAGAVCNTCATHLCRARNHLGVCGSQD